MSTKRRPVSFGQFGGLRLDVPIDKTAGRPTRSETETWGVPVR